MAQNQAAAEAAMKRVKVINVDLYLYEIEYF